MKGEMENIEIKKGKIKYISFGLIMAMNFFRFSILSIIVASFPSIQQEFTLTNVELSFISTAFYLFSFVFTYLWIYLSGKYSNRLVFTIGTAFWVLPLFYFPYIQSYTVLILIVSLIGIGAESVVVVLTNYFISLNLQGQFARVYSIQVVVQGAGGIFGTFLVIQIQGFYNYNWQDIFTLIAIISCILFIITYIMLFSKSVKNKLEGFENQKYSLNIAKIKEIFRIRENLLIEIALLIIVPALTFLNIWTQLYFITEHSVSKEIAIITFLYLFGIAFLGFICSGIIVDYFKKKNIKVFKSVGLYAIALAGIFFICALSIPWELESVAGENFIEMCINLLIAVLSDFKTTLSYIFFTLAFFTYPFIDAYTASLIEYFNVAENKQIMLNINKGLNTFSHLIGPIIGGIIADTSGFKTMFFHVPIALFLMLIPLIIMVFRKDTPKSDLLDTAQ